ncbi:MULTISPECIES: hypothetical protein [Nocardia]|uniref:hypothetical protein n=1 Tax=Nocardia TaxID=1817 RepID=UPI001300A975|nr:MULTISPECIES: hypothetical protein [Nocardia]
MSEPESGEEPDPRYEPSPSRGLHSWEGWAAVGVIVSIVLGLFAIAASSAASYTTSARSCAEKLHTAGNFAGTLFVQSLDYHNNPGRWKMPPALVFRDAVYDVYRNCATGRCDFYRQEDHTRIVGILTFAASLQQTGDFPGSAAGGGGHGISSLDDVAYDFVREAETRALNAANRSEPRQMAQVVRNWFCFTELEPGDF